MTATRTLATYALAFYLGATAALLIPLDSYAFALLSSLARALDPLLAGVTP